MSRALDRSTGVAAGLGLLALLGLLEGIARGMPPSRLAALSLLIVGPGVAALTLMLELVSRRAAPVASGMAAGLVLHLVSRQIIRWDRDWNALAIQPESLLGLSLFAAVLVAEALIARAVLWRIGRLLPYSAKQPVMWVSLALTASVIAHSWMVG